MRAAGARARPTGGLTERLTVSLAAGFTTRLRARLAGSALARGSAAGLVTQGLRLGAQAAYFVALARALPAAEYGVVVAALGFVGLAAPFATWGAGDLLVQRVARERVPFGEAWGEALRSVLLGGLACGVLVPAAGLLVLPGTVPLALLVAAAAGEYWGAALVTVGGQAHQAHERMGRAGAGWVALVAARGVGAVALLAGLVPRPPVAWGLTSLAVSLPVAGWTVWQVDRAYGRPVWRAPRRPRAGRDGFQYALGLSALSVYNDIDRTMLARLGTLAATGVYGAGYRMLEVGFAPVTALLAAAYARLFRLGAEGVRPAARFGLRLLPAAVALASLAAAALALAAPLVPRVLGAGYGEVSGVVRALALLLPLRAVQYAAANTLTGAGRQGARSAAQVLAALGNVLLNLRWIPQYGWRGAAWATVATEGALAVGLWAWVAVAAGGERRALKRRALGGTPSGRILAAGGAS